MKLFHPTHHLPPSLALAGLLVTATAMKAAPQQTLAPSVAAEQRTFLEASRHEHAPAYEWKPVATFTFDDAAALKDFRITDGEWKIKDGQLKATGNKPGGNNRTILITPEIEGAQRIEFDATLLPRPDGRVGDICVRLNADPQTGSFARGYALIAAQYFNQANVCYRLNIPIARTECSPVVPGKRHHIILEWRLPEGHLRFFVDDTIVVDAWDRAAPLPPDPTKWIGLSTYGTDMIVDNLVISSGTLVPKAPRKPEGKPAAKPDAPAEQQ